VRDAASVASEDTEARFLKKLSPITS